MQRWWTLPVLYVIFIAYQSLIGANVWSCKRELTLPFLRSMTTVSWSDFLANVIAYVPLGFLLAAPRVPLSVRRGMWWALAGGFLLSALMESLQRCLPGRIPSSLDVIANTAGALAGGFLAWTWASALRARLPVRGQVPDGEALLRRSAVSLLLGLAVLCWVAYQTTPWVFTFDVSQVRANFAWVKQMAVHRWSWFSWFRHLGAWTSLLLAWRLCVSLRQDDFRQRDPTKLWLTGAIAVMVLAVIPQVALQGKALGPEELAAMGFAFLVCLGVSLVLGRHKHVHALLSLWVALFAWLAVLAYQAEPAKLTGLHAPARRVSWLPEVGMHQLISAIDYALFFAWFGVMLALAACARPGARLRFQKLAAQQPGEVQYLVLGWRMAMTGAVAVALTEVMQFWIPGRSVDTSPVMFTMLGYMFANRMVSRPTPVSLRDEQAALGR